MKHAFFFLGLCSLLTGGLLPFFVALSQADLLTLHAVSLTFSCGGFLAAAVTGD